jgi:hypothetical protein
MNNQFDELTKTMAQSVTAQTGAEEIWRRPRSHGIGLRRAAAESASCNLPGILSDHGILFSICIVQRPVYGH